MRRIEKRILSGMRPTGPMHLGHLVGALRNWSDLQSEYKCFYMVADWHALMSEYENPAPMHDYIRQMVADWIACGIDPEKSTIFIQSQVPEHLELAMILGCLTPLPWLERCPTYKEQLRETKKRDLTTYGFLGYPVLQAADILAYKATHVPVGEDQLAHLELTREITRKFNKLYGKILIEPKAILTKIPRLLGTDNRKMSKSYDNFIALSDKPEAVESKVSNMITDPKRVRLTDKGHPDICNVFSYKKVFKGGRDQSVEALRDLCITAKMGCTECKEELGRAAAELLRPIRENSRAILDQKGKIDQILVEGAEEARKITRNTLGEIKEVLKLG